VVNFNYVSSPKFVQSRKFLLMYPLAYQSFRSFWSFPTNNMWDLFASTCKTDCLQILYKFCKNWISVPNIVHQLTLSLRCEYCKIHSRSNFQDAINSIRRSAAERLQANDVSLLCSFVSSPLEHAYRRPFLTVFGEFVRQNVVDHRVDPKRHFLTSQRVFWTILSEIPWPGYFSRRVREKIKIKKRCLIFNVFRQRSLTADWHKFRVTCSTRGLNQLCKVLS